MQLSPNFSLEQFTRSDAAIKNGIANTPLPKHLKNLTHLAKCMEDGTPTNSTSSKCAIQLETLSS